MVERALSGKWTTFKLSFDRLVSNWLMPHSTLFTGFKEFNKGYVTSKIRLFPVLFREQKGYMI